MYLIIAWVNYVYPFVWALLKLHWHSTGLSGSRVQAEWSSRHSTGIPLDFWHQSPVKVVWQHWHSTRSPPEFHQTSTRLSGSRVQAMWSSRHSTGTPPDFHQTFWFQGPGNVVQQTLHQNSTGIPPDLWHRSLVKVVQWTSPVRFSLVSVPESGKAYFSMVPDSNRTPTGLQPDFHRTIFPIKIVKSPVKVHRSPAKSTGSPTGLVGECKVLNIWHKILSENR